MGSGKTRMGELLAEQWQCGFVDLDKIFESRTQTTIVEYFAQHGEQQFRDYEHQIINEYCPQTPPMVISGGGGAFTFERNRTIIAEHCVSVYLNVDPNVIWERVKDKRHRPLLLQENPREIFDNLYQKRHPIYSHADLVVNLGEGSKDYNLKILSNAILAKLDQ